MLIGNQHPTGLLGCRFGERRRKGCERFTESWIVDLLRFHVPEEHVPTVLVANDLKIK